MVRRRYRRPDFLWYARDNPTCTSPIRAHFVWFTLGIIVAVFFKCMVALFNPAYRRGEPIRWGLVSYTVVMFSLVTVGTAMRLGVQSISYIDNREFRGTVPGPIGYQGLIVPDAINVIQNVIFALNNWLADGLLVSSLFDTAFILLRCLTSARLALSLLCDLLYEPLGPRLPLPHVPWFIGCVFELSTNRR